MRRPLSLLGALVAVVTALVSLAPAASAAGTGGIEVTPVPTVDGHGHPITAFHVSGGSTARFALRNITGQKATVRLYAASASRSPGGSYAIGAAGSAPWVGLATETVTLGPHAVQMRKLHIADHGIPKGTKYAAVVVEQTEGNVVQRAATLVYLAAGSWSPVKRAVLPLIVAGLLVGVGVALHGRVRATA